MQSTQNLLNQEGMLISVAGHQPLLLTDTGSVWLVEQGKVVIFSVQVQDSEVVGKRNSLFEAGAGEILFGISPLGEDTKHALLATGITGTRLRQISKTRFWQLAEQTQWKDKFNKLVSHWIDNLANGTAESAPGLRKAVEDWKKEPSPVSLEQLNNLALQQVIEQGKRQEAHERQLINEKIKSDQWYMKNAISRLVNISQPGEGVALGEDSSEDPLLTACRLVGRALKINIIPPPKPQGAMEPKDPLGDIARASRIRFRQVVLKEGWWKLDNGSLVAYMEEDNRPVALIPLSPSEYRLHDPVKGTVCKVNNQIAQDLKPFAIVFYRPFPHKVLKVLDILKFGSEGSWKQDVVMVVLMGLLGGLLGMLIPVATGIVFDSIVPQGERTQLLQIGFFLAASALATMLFQLTRSLAMLRMEGKTEGAIQAAVWDRLLSLPVPFYRKYSSGELAMRAMGISQIRSMLSGVTISSILTGLFSIFNLGLLFYYNVKLALFATLLVLAAISVTMALGYWKVRYKRQTVDITNKLAGFVLQVISGISKLRISGTEKRAFYLWSRHFSQQRRISFKCESISAIMETFNAVFPVVASMIIFYLMIKNIDNGLGAGKFIAFNSAFTNFLTNMVALSESLLSINGIIPLYERAKPILEELPEYDEAKGDPGELTGTIEVSHLSFRYKKDGPLILNNISLQIKEGEYVALVGTSGSGKSTLFRVLLGFEKAENGRVYYTGQDLEKVDIRGVRRQLGVVLQNGQLMSGDIFTNIVGANPHLTMDDAWEAARRAGLDKDIDRMPMGMHTVISEGGGTLSGGQRQRLLIARAIVNKPKILYFDEATSALDNRTQAIVSESLDNLKATRVVIAHRLSTIMNCHRIIVMDQGRIVEDGNYEELMGRNGVFTELAKRQLA